MGTLTSLSRGDYPSLVLISMKESDLVEGYLVDKTCDTPDMTSYMIEIDMRTSKL